jgi:glycosyltransferase involved in cell wall biosynthesis
MEAELAREILGSHRTRIYIAFNGVPSERLERLRGVRPDLESLRIVFIGSGGSVYWRAWYKGLDLMLRAFQLARERIPRLHFTVVGEWSQSVIQKLLEESGLACTDSVDFLGKRDDIESVLQGSSLYLHCGRGDAYGISVLEAMCAGVVPIVSEWTGSKEVVAQVDERLVVPLRSEEIAERILWYFGIRAEERRALSERCRDVVANYTEERAVQTFREAFAKMISELYG